MAHVLTMRTARRDARDTPIQARLPFRASAHNRTLRAQTTSTRPLDGSKRRSRAERMDVGKNRISGPSCLQALQNTGAAAGFSCHGYSDNKHPLEAQAQNVDLRIGT